MTHGDIRVIFTFSGREILKVHQDCWSKKAISVANIEPKGVKETNNQPIATNTPAMPGVRLRLEPSKLAPNSNKIIKLMNGIPKMSKIDKP